jgi:hypothetical protein
VIQVVRLGRLEVNGTLVVAYVKFLRNHA